MKLQKLALQRTIGSQSARQENRIRGSVCLFVDGVRDHLAERLQRGSLSAAEREVVVLRVVLELDGETAASVLGIRPTAVSTRLSRALQKLEERMVNDVRA